MYNTIPLAVTSFLVTFFKRKPLKGGWAQVWQLKSAAERNKPQSQVYKPVEHIPSRPTERQGSGQGFLAFL